MIDMWFHLGTFQKQEDCVCDDDDDEEIGGADLVKGVLEDDTIPALERC